MADKYLTTKLMKLDGSNYSMWKFGVMFVLDAKELTGHVQDTEAEPDRQTKLIHWYKAKKDQSKASVILLSSVEKKLHPNLINCMTPNQTGRKLADLYGVSSEDAKQSAWEEFYAFRIKVENH